MALADLVLKAMVNMELIRDPHTSPLQTHVAVQDGVVILTGDHDTESQRHAAEECARRVPGVVDVKNEMTCGMIRQADTVEVLKLRLLEKLTDGWNSLPGETIRAQVDYMRWALWLIHKFRIPEQIGGDSRVEHEAEVREAAVAQVSGALNVPSVLLWLELEQMPASSQTTETPPSSPASAQ